MTTEVQLTADGQFPAAFKLRVPDHPNGSVVSIEYLATAWGTTPEVTAQWSADDDPTHALPLGRPDPAAAADDQATGNRVPDTFTAANLAQYRLRGGYLWFDVAEFDAGTDGLVALVNGCEKVTD